jgi:hypothetical protein
MPALDQRLADGLRDLLDRALVGADIWPATARCVTKHERDRRGPAGWTGLLAIGRRRGRHQTMWGPVDRRAQP